MRKLLWTLAIAVSLIVVADRVGASVGAHVVAAQLKASGSLSSKPSVDIKGFPFLTQAAAGRYDRIELSVNHLSRSGVSFARLDVTVRGARITLRQALAGHVGAVPVEGLSATALVDYAEIVSRGGLVGVTMRPVAGGVQLRGRLTVLGASIMASTVSSVRLEHADLVVTAQSVAVEGQSSPAIDAAVRGRFDVRIPIGPLPFGLRLTGVRATAAGVLLTASSGPTLLERP